MCTCDNQGFPVHIQTTNAGFEFMKSLKEHNDEILRLSSLLARA